MVSRDTGLYRVGEEHVEYLATLPEPTRQLIVLRDTRFQGSWQALEARLTDPARKRDVQDLRKYEADNAINLAFYMRLFVARKQGA